MSLLTCLSKLAFLWGQGRLPGVISRENLKVSWQLPCSPITYSLTIKFCRKVAAVEEKIVQIEWDYYGIWKHPTISIIRHHNSNTMLHSWKKDLCGAHRLGPDLLAIQVHVWGWELGFKQSLHTIFCHLLGPPSFFTDWLEASVHWPGNCPLPPGYGGSHLDQSFLLLFLHGILDFVHLFLEWVIGP